MGEDDGEAEQEQEDIVKMPTGYRSRKNWRLTTTLKALDDSFASITTTTITESSAGTEEGW